ncbi:conserved Plasmodium protein, unknown function [Plasmodium malariae]|uniref:Uncharacterized protein n=1 Tax=Plasmodium malariae TaxID=5858 RepID=A0A1C3KZI6_PLAMA|nr:conserved Plasmodium protein, unknown function [Plasmodium malariae]
MYPILYDNPEVLRQSYFNHYKFSNTPNGKKDIPTNRDDPVIQNKPTSQLEEGGKKMEQEKEKNTDKENEREREKENRRMEQHSKQIK